MPGDNQPKANEQLAEAQLAQVISLLPREITEEQQSQVRDRLKHSIELAEKVRATPITNADEPEIVFRPYRRPER
ncbi:hypothetical protein BH23CHL4_BH23CHL4_28960 [soil metagenome]